MTTGMTRPVSALVAALNSLQNAMMLTPCWPRAGPTGGAGLAWPAGICNLICPIIFLAIKIRLARLSFLHLPILQFDRSVAPENVDSDFEFAAIRLDLFNHPAEIQERPVINLDRFAGVKMHLRLLGLFALGDLRLDGRNLVRRHRNGPISPHNADFARRVLDKVPRLLQNPALVVQ